MLIEDVNILNQLNVKFLQDADRVSSFMSLYDDDYLHIDYWRIEDGTVYGYGNLGCNEYNPIYVSFDTELLSYSDDELRDYVDSLIEKRNKAKQKQAEENEKFQKLKDMAEFIRIKEKYNL